MNKLDQLIQGLQELKGKLFDNKPLEDHPLMVLAEELNSEIALGMISATLSIIDDAISGAISNLEDSKNLAEDLSPDKLDELAAVASEFDASDDEMLIRQASVLDTVLDIFASKEIDSNKTSQGDKHLDRAKEVVQKAMKIYRPLEASGQTRTCPDHPGAQMQRVADYVYQCSMDKKIYDYKQGYTTMSGNKVPGSSLDLQTQPFNSNNIQNNLFDTREGRLSLNS